MANRTRDKKNRQRSANQFTEAFKDAGVSVSDAGQTSRRRKKPQASNRCPIHKTETKPCERCGRVWYGALGQVWAQRKREQSEAHAEYLARVQQEKAQEPQPERVPLYQQLVGQDLAEKPRPRLR